MKHKEKGSFFTKDLYDNITMSNAFFQQKIWKVFKSTHDPALTLMQQNSQPRSHMISTTLGSISTGSRHRCTALPRISSNRKWTRLEAHQQIYTESSVKTGNLLINLLTWLWNYWPNFLSIGYYKSLHTNLLRKFDFHLYQNSIMTVNTETGMKM